MSVRDGLLVRVGDRRYVADTEGITWATVRPTRQGVDQGAGAGEASLSNEVVWRRVRDNWVGGAGQEYADLVDPDDESSALRFVSSENIDPWGRRALQLALPPVVEHNLRADRATPGTDSLQLLLPRNDDYGGGYWIVDDDRILAANIEPDSTPPSWAEHAAAASIVAAAGFGDNRIFYTTGGGVTEVSVNQSTGAETSSSFGAEDADMLAACSSRLIGAYEAEIFELDNVGAGTTIYTHPVSAFRWTGAVAAPNSIYAWGRVGGTSQVFRLPISDATGAIDPPIPALAMPNGEQVTTMVPYLGVMLIGTSNGFRVGVIEADGSLSIGALIDDVGQVDSIAVVDQYTHVVGGESPGVWRLNLSRFTDTLTPAFASDGWEIASGLTGTPNTVPRAVGVVPVLDGTQVGQRLLAMTRDLVVAYPPDAGVASTGDIDLGWFTFGIGESLSLDSITVECDNLPGGSAHEVVAYVDTPELNAAVTLTNDFTDASTLTAFAAHDIRARRFRVRLELTGDTSEGTSPVVRSVTLRATPAPFMSDGIILPLMIRESVQSEQGQVLDFTVLDEWLYLIGLRDTRERVTVNIGDYEATARVESVEVSSSGLGGGNGLDGFDAAGGFLKGTWQVRLVTVQDEAVSSTVIYGAGVSIDDDDYGGSYA